MTQYGSLDEMYENCKLLAKRWEDRKRRPFQEPVNTDEYFDNMDSERYGHIPMRNYTRPAGVVSGINDMYLADMKSRIDMIIVTLIAILFIQILNFFTRLATK